MNAYFDASALVSLWIHDRHYAPLWSWYTAMRPKLIVSDFGGAEMIAALSLRVRTRQTDIQSAKEAIADYERTIVGNSLILTTPADIASTTDVLKRFDLALRAPDALHIAICRRIGATLVTFDDRQLRGAIALGVPVVEFAPA